MWCGDGRTSGKLAAQKKAEVIEREIHEVSDLLAEGKRPYQITEILGMSRPKVTLRIQEAKRTWNVQRLDRLDEWRCAELVKIDALEAFACEELEKSRVRRLTDTQSTDS